MTVVLWRTKQEEIEGEKNHGDKHTCESAKAITKREIAFITLQENK
jgi:hypothetical protein